MDMSVIDILKVVGQGGFPVLFALLLIGLGWMVVKLGPQIFGAWTSMIQAINELKTGIVTAIGEQNVKTATLTAKVDSMQTTLEAMRSQDVASVATATAAAAAIAAATKPPDSRASQGGYGGEDTERMRREGLYNLTDRDRDRRR